MNQKVSTGLGTAILIVMALTAGYFVWVIEKNNQQEFPIILLTSTQSIKSKLATELETKNGKKITTEDKETANWKLYKNIKYGFEFKYPTDWPAPILNEGEVYSSGSYPDEEDRPIWGLGIGKQEKVCEGELCFRLTLDGYDGDNYEKFSNGLKEHVFAEIKSEKTVNGTDVVVFTEGGSCGYLSAFLFGKDKTIKFSALCGEDEPELSQRFYQILATFKIY